MILLVFIIHLQLPIYSIYLQLTSIFLPIMYFFINCLSLIPKIIRFHFKRITVEHHEEISSYYLFDCFSYKNFIYWTKMTVFMFLMILNLYIMHHHLISISEQFPTKVINRQPLKQLLIITMRLSDHSTHTFRLIYFSSQSISFFLQFHENLYFSIDFRLNSMHIDILIP